MANALKGKTVVSITWSAPNDTAAEAMRVFFEAHLDLWRTRVIEKAH